MKFNRNISVFGQVLIIVRDNFTGMYASKKEKKYIIHVGHDNTKKSDNSLILIIVFLKTWMKSNENDDFKF